jgi:sulfide:quinone oxidoreductase
MKIKSITTDVAVAEQLNVSDIDELSNLGIKSIICNRPDGEAETQANHQEIKTAAIKAGIEFKYQPVIDSNVSNDEIQQFKNYLAVLPAPVLAYCRTGTRSATLWSFSQADVLSITEILNLTKTAGYEMSKVTEQIANTTKLS